MSIILIEIVLNRVVSNNANDTYLKLKKEAIPAMNTLAKYEAINREVFLLIVSKTYTQKVSFNNQNRINGILEVEFPYLRNEIFLLKENLKPNDPKIQKIEDIISYTNEMILLIEKLNNMLVSSNDFSNTTKMKLVNSILDNDITKYNSSLHNQLKSLQLNYNGLLEEYQNEFSSGLKSISNIILITGILGVLLGFAISFKMISYISKPISQLRRAAFEISKGNYGNEIIIKGKDEFFKLSKSFNRMSASLHDNFKLIAEQEERFKLMVESSPNALILSNKYGEIILTNRKAEELFGYNKKELIENSLVNLIPKKYIYDYATKLSYFFEHPDKKKNIENDTGLFGLRKDGTEFPIELGLNMVKLDGENLVLAALMDVTIRKTQEIKIKNFLEELKLKNKDLEHFTYITSHDLQEPLRTVTSFITLLNEEYRGKLSGNGEVYLNFIDEATTRMHQLINGLLDYSRLGKKTKLSLIDCNLLLNKLLEDIGNAVTHSGAKINLETLPKILGYEIELRLLFQNLILNAIKFRKKGTIPSIKISHDENKTHWIFCIQDNGIGISKAHLNKIFIIFQRLHDRGEYQGTGIGLAHCKKITELHNGDIWVQSKPNSGSSFYFTIQKKLT